MWACGAIIGIEDLRARDGATAKDDGDADAYASDGGCLTTACESNDENCAYCGHRCGAASTCVDRLCTPVDVATRIAGLFANSLCAFARDGDHLYVTLPEANDAGGWRTNVYEIVPSGEIAPRPVVSVDGLAYVKGIVATADRFYLLGPPELSATDDTFFACPRTGTGCNGLRSLHNAGGFAQSGDRFFATLRGERRVVALPIAPDAVATTVAQDSNYSPQDIVADQGAIYWREVRAPSVDGGALARVRRLATPPDGGIGQVDLLAELDASATSLSLHDNHVLFGVTGAIAAVPKTGGPLDLTPIRGRDDVTVFLADVSTAQWFAFAGTPATLYEKDRCSDSFVPIAAEKTFAPGRAAVFGNYIYWCTSGAGVPVPQHLRRVAR